MSRAVTTTADAFVQEALRWLPDAEELISPLAYACGREAADARARRP